MAEKARRRPTSAKVEAANISAGNLDVTTVPEILADERPRCRACRHVVWAEASVRSGYGPECRRALARERREAVAC